MQKTILLYDLEQPALILNTKTGVIYRNQVGGVNCLQEELEGALLPLSLSDKERNTLESLDYKISNHLGLNEQIIDSINNLLSNNSDLNFLEVDSNKFKNSREAWIYLRKKLTPKEGYGFLFENFPFEIAILTWQNSD